LARGVHKGPAAVVVVIVVIVVYTAGATSSTLVARSRIDVTFLFTRRVVVGTSVSPRWL